MNKATTFNPSVKTNFKNGLRWNLVGSMAYEGVKIIHHLFLLKFLDVPLYGMIGSTLGLLYFTTKIADFGTTFSLPPFFHLFSKSKNGFKKLFFVHFLLPQSPIIILASLAATYFYRQKLITHSSLFFLFPIIIILETVRSFFRYFLNFYFKTKTVVLLELTTFFSYVASMWLCVLVFNYPISLNLTFTLHTLESGIVVLIFALLTYSIYKKIPNQEGELPEGVGKRILNMRVFNYLLRISKDLFTRNFLTPLFALKFGFEQAGFFFFAGTIATSIQSIIKYSIGYSGNALFANIKQSPQSVKKEAFDLLCRKLTKIVAPIIIFLLLNYKFVMKIGKAGNPTLTTFALFLMFLILILAEFFLLLYEQFYIIEEASRKLFFFKALEFILLYIAISSKTSSTPLMLLTNMLIIRLISFIIIAINAYFNWKIWPRVRAEIRYLAGCTAGALIFSFIF